MRAGPSVRGIDLDLGVEVGNFTAHVALVDCEIGDADFIQASSRTGRQMPLVTKRGPQSHPYSYAALRM